MEIKYTLQGYIIYCAIAAYLAAFITMAAAKQKAGRMLFFIGFILSALAFIYRWFHVGHVPLQNFFEVFICLGMVCYPISWFCQRKLKVGAQWADMLIAVVVLFPAGFIFEAEPQHLPPMLQSVLFLPHVAVYMLSYIFMAKAVVQAFLQLIVKKNYSTDTLEPEKATYIMVCAGFPLLTLGLILGSIWGKLAWGDYLNWDPKELWSLACWFAYVGYFHFLYMF